MRMMASELPKDTLSNIGVGVRAKAGVEGEGGGDRKIC